MAKHVNIKSNWTIIIKNKIYNIQDQKSKFYYNILVDKKGIPNYMQKVWERTFNMPIKWSSVYNNQVWNIKEKKLSEFNYKLLCNILYTKTTISKWNNNVSTACDYCNEDQTPRHLIYECPRAKNLWKIVGTVLQLDISYRHIILGNMVTNKIIYCRNLLLSYVAYGIYKFWVMSENNKVNFLTDSLQKFIRIDLFKRSVYLNNTDFSMLVDRVISVL